MRNRNGNGIDDSTLIPNENRQQILNDLMKASKDIVKRPTITVKYYICESSSS